jgi:hypothetical protein
MALPTAGRTQTSLGEFCARAGVEENAINTTARKHWNARPRSGRRAEKSIDLLKKKELRETIGRICENSLLDMGADFCFL